MASFGIEALRAYLLLVDSRLTKDASIILIGGGAIALAHDPRYATLDLDTYESRGETAFWAAVEATKNDPRAVPVQEVTVGDAPHRYSERLTRLALPGASRLTVLLPEAHDLAVMKALRGNEHDLAGIETIHHGHRLRLETFLERIWETTHAMGHPDRIRQNFLLAIERVFGEKAADRVQEQLAAWPTLTRDPPA